MEKEKIRVALKKARTQIDRIMEDIEGEKHCFPIMQQTLAVIGLLKSANQAMLKRHIETVLSSVSGLSPKKKENLERELIKIIETAQSK